MGLFRPVAGQLFCTRRRVFDCKQNVLATGIVYTIQAYDGRGTRVYSTLRVKVLELEEKYIEELTLRIWNEIFK
jgi:hypothetical protein